MSEEITLRVRPLDRAPRYGTAGENVPIMEVERKTVAAKLTEEAAEAFTEWQDLEGRTRDLRRYRDFVANEDPETVHDMREELREQRDRLGDELGDVVVAAVDLAVACGVDLQGALGRNEARQVERGRIDG